MREHQPQLRHGDVVVRRVPDRSAPENADHLRRLVRHSGALGDRERERAVLTDEHLDALRPAAAGELQELGPSPRGYRSGRGVLEKIDRLGRALGEAALEFVET